MFNDACKKMDEKVNSPFFYISKQITDNVFYPHKQAERERIARVDLKFA